MTSIIISCSSLVILLSDGKHNPLSKISAPISLIPPLIYAFVLALPEPSLVINSCYLYIGCICIGFQIGLPSALIDAIAPHISVGQDLPDSGIYKALESSLTCLHI